MQPLLRPEDIYNGKPRKVQLSLRKIQDDVNDDANAPTTSIEEESKYVSQVCCHTFEKKKFERLILSYRYFIYVHINPSFSLYFRSNRSLKCCAILPKYQTIT